MNKIQCLLMATTITLAACNSGKEDKNADIIGKNSPKIENGILTPEILNSFGRITDLQISPDGKKLMYGVSYVSVQKNKSNRDLFIMNSDGSDIQQITKTAKSENNARWIQNGEKIAFLSSESGSAQIWEMKSDGSERVQVSDVKGGVEGFIYSPDSKKVLFVNQIKFGKRASDLYTDLPEATGRVVDDLMYKHWDEWVEQIPHPFVADIDGGKLTNLIDLMEGEPYECPTKPDVDLTNIAWSPDSKSVVYSARKKQGIDYAKSTNTDIYLYNLESKKTQNLTEGMMGYDTNPQFSPDGKSIAWISMARDGYESDLKRLFTISLADNSKTYVSEGFDFNCESFEWKANSTGIYMISGKMGTVQLFDINLANKNIRQITTDICDYQEVKEAGGSLVAVRHSMSKPNEIYSVNIQTGETKELSFENKAILDQLKMGKVEERWLKTTDGKQMLTWVVYPPNFDAKKRYPTILYCQGGPQSTVSQFFSYRWNLQLMAANGYIIVAPNRRGVPGFGQAWNEQISGDYGGQNMKDYLTAIDELCKEPFVNKDKLGAVGASYGGFSVYWLAGHHNKRFKAFIAHAGIFNLEQQYLETEELWFADWDLGGPFWDKNNAIAQRSFANSPHKFVDKWDTPILVSHGEKDYRILAGQGMSAFNAAKLRGIPAEMLIFPDENHWVMQPQNSILWHRTFYKWLDKWLK
ncbi:MAG: S9 family peptidase [Bacteroidales bacterium]|nr:S9 family peptidase [Bacteroidales bacterium]